MFDAQKAARDVARALLSIKAVSFRPGDPFTLTSGKKSPIYVDCRKINSFPEERSLIFDHAASLLQEQMGVGESYALAGGETAGISFAAFLAERLQKSMIYVRKKPKGFGRMAQIEGIISEGTRVLLVEDLVSYGTSKELFVKALRQAAFEVRDIFVVFYYDIFPQCRECLDSLGVRLHALCTWWDVLQSAREDSFFSEDVCAQVEKYLKNPDNRNT